MNQAFQDIKNELGKDIKNELGSSLTLSFFDPNKKMIVSADYSSYGLGAVLTQIKENGERRPVA